MSSDDCRMVSFSYCADYYLLYNKHSIDVIYSVSLFRTLPILFYLSKSILGKVMQIYGYRVFHFMNVTIICSKENNLTVAYKLRIIFCITRLIFAYYLIWIIIGIRIKVILRFVIFIGIGFRIIFGTAFGSEP